MDKLEQKRHSLAHLLGAAVVKLYPDSYLAIGPATKEGFYYDISFPKPIKESDLDIIEGKMREILPTWSEFVSKEVTKDEAREQFSGNPYKQELIEEIAANGEKITTVTSGDFTDLCGKPHISSAQDINPKGFYLSHIAAAYWRGDSNNDSLTRIYGIAFDTEEELNLYKEQQEKAKEIDHRKLGKEMELFSFSPLVGSGLPLFSPKGTAMREAIMDVLDVLLEKYSYEKVWIPHMGKASLYEKSGHLEKFGDELFKCSGSHDSFILKPMNCPHHTQIFSSTQKSYRDLPVRYAEHTTIYRDEKPGELLGLSRVRSVTQDDGHIFCTPDQIKGEIQNTIDLILDFYKICEIDKSGGSYKAVLSLRGENKDKYLGEDEAWDKAEQSLEECIKSFKGYTKAEGDAAFYGPKIDFYFTDALGRDWQLSTIQLDFVLPERFSLTYIGEDGKKHTPVMIHRAISGSIERFLSIMLEHFEGHVPFWLAPTQVHIITVQDQTIPYANEIKDKLKKASIRVSSDFNSESLGKKIKKAKPLRIPYKIVVGEKDKKAREVTLEHFKGEKEVVPFENIAQELKKKNPDLSI